MPRLEYGTKERNIHHKKSWTKIRNYKVPKQKPKEKIKDNIIGGIGEKDLKVYSNIEFSRKRLEPSHLITDKNKRKIQAVDAIHRVPKLKVSRDFPFSNKLLAHSKLTGKYAEAVSPKLKHTGPITRYQSNSGMYYPATNTIQVGVNSGVKGQYAPLVYFHELYHSKDKRVTDSVKGQAEFERDLIRYQKNKKLSYTPSMEELFRNQHKNLSRETRAIKFHHFMMKDFMKTSLMARRMSPRMRALNGIMAIPMTRNTSAVRARRIK
jgi:hypothetical protein